MQAPPAAPLLVSAPPNRGEGGDAVTERVALARGGWSPLWLQGCARGAGDKEPGGGGARVGEERDPAAGSGPAAGVGGVRGGGQGRVTPRGGGRRRVEARSWQRRAAVAGQRRAGRAGVLPPCPRLRCQGEGFAAKLLQGMTQPGCASVLAVGSGRAEAPCLQTLFCLSLGCLLVSAPEEACVVCGAFPPVPVIPFCEAVRLFC